MIKSEEMQVIPREKFNTFDNKDFQDIKQMQEISIRQGEKMAALGQLAGAIALDFNNQLMSIIGNATMIQRADDLARIKEYAERIIQISQSTANLTKSILMFSKEESSISKPINLKSVMEKSYAMAETILDKNIELSYKYGAVNKVILGDEAQIENLIFNLMLNSKDALVNSNGRIEVGTVDTVVFSNMVLSHGETLKPGQYITVYVEDNGTGIKEDELMNIFEPYFTTKLKSRGTGLGLSVVYGIVKSHSGFINVRSNVGEGTRFEIFFPIYSRNKLEKNVTKLNIESNLVMLVDDDENALDVESELIEDLGYDVIKFSKPLEALDYFKENHSELAFSIIDLSMPIMTGKQLYDEIKKIDKHSKAFFITGRAKQADYEELIKEDEVIIQKPFTYEDLSAQIAKIYM